MDLENAYDKIYRYVYFRIKDQTVAEDITQETFLRFISQKGNIYFVSFCDAFRKLAICKLEANDWMLL